ncbi:Protein-disulfide isomerase [Candidatus Competibacter denitrificans Run_A_D11]|uniref:Thiol:disulfide interchange protein n=1 Tax=Candidatus Competibacter denitrificans Run_A_D11 TaxID=1400863 RepID=W6MDD7_9GAMM|nr:DsbC family protein [Candidatus Competibacter denitrificans]CDI02698.1 Protein-disulfide isomerase [Candidatus Competibacter denitrificans Run_A_D11]HAS86332.1 DsbC family protein [Candidatus Competibacteraceae bacterium]HRC69943.1 DsbC family protein [Candidatus Competibacter denitrificans]
MRKTLLFVAVLYAVGALAADPTPQTPPADPAPAATAKRPDTTHLQTVLKGEKPDSITPSAIPGLYEVVLGGQVIYLSEDGQFAVQGEIVNLTSLDNLTENRRGQLRGKAIDALGEQNMVIFSPEGPVKHTVTVFTDIDCGYCRKLHTQMEAYNKEGIKVRYLWFPREGIDSESYKKAVAVWCADDRRAAMTKAKRGENIELKSCDNPVKREYELGQKLGVRGTPSIILESGDMIPGYVSPTQLAEMLAEVKSKTAKPLGQP